jgi:TRAP-type C4-dicarboxylate transport system permease small subunit
MKKVLKRIVFVIEKIAEYSSFIGAIILVFLMLYIGFEIIMRMFRHPINGDVEVSVSMIVCVVYFAFAYAAFTDHHVRVTLFKRWVFLDHLNYIVCGGCAVYVGIQCANQAIFAHQLQITTQNLHIPRSVFLMVTAFGFLLFALVSFALEINLILKQIEDRKKKRSVASLTSAS